MLRDVVGRSLGRIEEPFPVIVAWMVECELVVHGDDDAVVILAQLGEHRRLDHVLVAEQPVHRPHQNGLDLVALDALTECLKTRALVDPQPTAGADPSTVRALVLDIDEDLGADPAE